MKHFAFPRQARLKSKKAIDRLYVPSIAKREGVRAESCVAYPLRAIWIPCGERNDGYQGVKILISVPKKRLRHAVDRVAMRRRIREAWRLQIADAGIDGLDLALNYISNQRENYSRIYSSVTKIISKLREQ